MKIIRAVLQIICIFTIMFSITIPVYSEEIGYNSLLCGDFSIPLTIRFGSPEYRTLAQFGKERLESLNRLIRHFSLDISLDGHVSEMTVSVDGDPLYSVSEYVDHHMSSTVYSFDPETVYRRSAEKEKTSSYPEFLDSHFFLINRMLDDLYPVFEKIADSFPGLTKTSSDHMNYREYGKAVRKTVITFPSDFVREQFPEVLSDFAGNEETRGFIGQFHFSGMQKIALYFNENGNILRINYDGILGMTEDSMRKISLSWRCLRSEQHKKDHLSLKSPSVKGYDKYNLTYIRDLDLTDSGKHVLNWDFQLDLKDGDNKKKVKYDADLSFSDDLLTGNIIFNEKQDGKEQKTILVPEIKKENTDEYSGTLEITCISGKITISSILSVLRISAREPINWPAPSEATATDIPSETKRHTEDELRSITEQTIIRRLLALPEEDLDFLCKDIPEDVWNSIRYSLLEEK